MLFRSHELLKQKAELQALKDAEAEARDSHKADLQAQKEAAAEARKLAQAADRALKAEQQAQKAAAAEARRQSQAINRARKQLKRAGIEAWRQERLRKKSVAELTQSGLPIPPHLQDPITDPEADSGSEYESASEGGHESAWEWE